MRSSARGRNAILTWYAARRVLDTRFEQVRQNAMLRLHRNFTGSSGQALTADDDFARAIFLRIHREQWKLAIADLKRALLPQRTRRLYRPVRSVNRTVGRREKVRPRNSRKQKALAKANRPRLRKRPRKQWKKPRWKSAHTSHHVGKYVSQGRRGRPEKHREAKPKKKVKRHRKVRQRSNGRIAIARAVLGAKAMFSAGHDKRANHDPRYGYLAPRKRERRTAAEVAKGRKPRKHHEGTGNDDAGVALAKRRFTADIRRSVAMKAYWGKVRKLAGK